MVAKPQPRLPERSVRSAQYRTSGDIGDPQIPFPWLTWNNRPYVSPLELMLVSWLPSSQLLLEIQPGETRADDPYSNYDKPFRHLTNFFLSGPARPTRNCTGCWNSSGSRRRLPGTEVWANPTNDYTGTELLPAVQSHFDLSRAGQDQLEHDL